MTKGALHQKNSSLYSFVTANANSNKASFTTTMINENKMVNVVDMFNSEADMIAESVNGLPLVNSGQTNM